ncbi:hypothetical protein KCU72_g23036, partial [Aureobasidium melanogenum]
MDRESVYTLSVFPEDRSQTGEDSRGAIQDQFVKFIMAYSVSNGASFPYRDQIKENYLAKQYYCDVDIAHVATINEQLAHRLNNEPADMIPLFEAAIKHCAQRIIYPSQRNVN